MFKNYMIKSVISMYFLVRKVETAGLRLGPTLVRVSLIYYVPICIPAYSIEFSNTVKHSFNHEVRTLSRERNMLLSRR
jgi:hypothetical protein